MGGLGAWRGTTIYFDDRPNPTRKQTSSISKLPLTLTLTHLPASTDPTLVHLPKVFAFLPPDKLSHIPWRLPVVYATAPLERVGSKATRQRLEPRNGSENETAPLANVH